MKVLKFYRQLGIIILVITIVVGLVLLIHLEFRVPAGTTMFDFDIYWMENQRTFEKIGVINFGDIDTADEVKDCWLDYCGTVYAITTGASKESLEWEIYYDPNVEVWLVTGKTGFTIGRGFSFTLLINRDGFMMWRRNDRLIFEYE